MPFGWPKNQANIMFAWYYQPLSHRYNNFRIFVVKYAPTEKNVFYSTTKQRNVRGSVRNVVKTYFVQQCLQSTQYHLKHREQYHSLADGNIFPFNLAPTICIYMDRKHVRENMLILTLKKKSLIISICTVLKYPVLTRVNPFDVHLLPSCLRPFRSTKQWKILIVE